MVWTHPRESITLVHSCEYRSCLLSFAPNHTDTSITRPTQLLLRDNNRLATQSEFSTQLSTLPKDQDPSEYRSRPNMVCTQSCSSNEL